jgi:hypothetical protein
VLLCARCTAQGGLLGPPPSAPVSEIFRVFRTWSLDFRRVPLLHQRSQIDLQSPAGSGLDLSRASWDRIGVLVSVGQSRPAQERHTEQQCPSLPVDGQRKLSECCNPDTAITTLSITYGRLPTTCAEAKTISTDPAMRGGQDDHDKALR